MKNPYEGIDKLAPSMRTAVKTVYATFELLKENEGELRAKEVILKVPNKVELTSWEKERYEKSGYVRWESILHFYSIDCTKAGYLRKLKGIWYLTPEGEEAMKLGAVKLLQSASKKYRQWDSERKNSIDELPDTITDETKQEATIEQLEEVALEGIRDHIRSKNPYEFQDIVAALLRAMGYSTPYISPKGRDGGLDIIAFQDPLGAKVPRIKVQVKHRPDASIPVTEIRSLLGILNKDGDVGLFVTSGKFTSEADNQARDSHIHIKLIDGDTLIDLWKSYYSKLSDEEKNMIPLQSIYFLGDN